MKKNTLPWWMLVPALTVSMTAATIGTFFHESVLAWLTGLAILAVTTAIDMHLYRRFTSNEADSKANAD